MTLFAKCINNIGYEWLLEKDCYYSVVWWSDKGVISIDCHEKGKHGLKLDRFDFNPPRHGIVIDYSEFIRYGNKKYSV